MDFQEDRYFGFLVNQGFKGPFNFNIAYEMHTTYVRGKIIIDIAYDGGYQVYIVRTKRLIPELETGKKKLSDLDFSESSYHALTELDPKKKIFNSVDFNNQIDKQLWYYSKLLLDNPEILLGDLKKFNFFNILLRRLRSIKNH
jgi:hypothetical protein